MKLQSKYSEIILNLLIALAISMVVNFSYLLLLIVDQKSEPSGHTNNSRKIEIAQEGLLSVTPDGHGYIIYKGLTEMDSVYVPMSRIRRLGLDDGDMLVVNIMPRRVEGAHPMMLEILSRNGKEFDYSTIFNRPSAMLETTIQLLYYLVLSFILLTILTVNRSDYSLSSFIKRSLVCLVVAVFLYFLAPVAEKHSGRFVMNFMNGRYMDYMLLLKCSFAVVVAILYGRIYTLISQRQAVVVENEQLKNENLTTRYNMLVSQINPHFFFNSLNSLAMLVREKEDDKALLYIDQLSYTFRYIIQNGQSTLSTLEEEMRFIEAYSYLFKIRYAEKLFFDVDIDPKYKEWVLPALSLQPLIDNAVKHNVITKKNPFHVSIKTQGECLVISNPKIPKIEAEPSTGIGLENLRNRWQLITGQNIEIIDEESEFTVRLPLQKQVKQQ